MKQYQLENENVLIEFLSYGGILTKMVNKKTNQNYLLAYEKEEDYLTNPYFFGATIGRNAGRTYPPFYINHQGEKVELDTNEGKVHLHGGKNGLHQVEWQVEKINSTGYLLTFEDDASLYEPMKLELVYTLKDNCFKIEMKGSANDPTICNLTNHSYFNLSQEETINEHFLKTAPATIQLIDQQFVPTEEYSRMQEVEYRSFDFSQEKKLQTALKQNTDLSKLCAEGIDLAYYFNQKECNTAKIELSDAERKNRLTIYSDQGACVIYTLNKLSTEENTNKGTKVKKFGGITFEMQRKPNYVHTEKNYLTNDYHSCTVYEIE